MAVSVISIKKIRFWRQIFPRQRVLYIAKKEVVPLKE